MNLKQLVEALDAQIVKGDILGAFDTFAADNCVTFSNPQDITHSKAQKAEALRWFFDNIASTNRVERVAVAVGENVTDSQFVFDFTNRQGNPLVFSEIIRRTWQDGKIVEEQYLLNQTLVAPQTATAKNATQSPAQTTEPAASKPAKSSKKAEPAADKKPAAKSAQTTPAKADDLTLVEGIGPKIAELLVKGGIANIEQLAAAQPADIQTILDAAGKRYQIHDPSTWPQQAALARDGKTAELQQLQDKLKAGRK